MKNGKTKISQRKILKVCLTILIKKTYHITPMHGYSTQQLFKNFVKFSWENCCWIPFLGTSLLKIRIPSLMISWEFSQNLFSKIPLDTFVWLYQQNTRHKLIVHNACPGGLLDVLSEAVVRRCSVEKVF